MNVRDTVASELMGRGFVPDSEVAYAVADAALGAAVRHNQYEDLRTLLELWIRSNFAVSPEALDQALQELLVIISAPSGAIVPALGVAMSDEFPFLTAGTEQWQNSARNVLTKMAAAGVSVASLIHTEPTPLHAVPKETSNGN